MAMARKVKDLPFDIILLILHRLPVKSLLRFRSVSNLYRRTIDDPDFVKSHQKNGTRSTLLFVHKGDSMFQLEEDQNEILRPMTVSSLLLDERARLVCSAQGFFLFFSDQDCKIYLCNPSRRECLVLPAPKNAGIKFGLGLGFNSSMDEYKIVYIDKKNIHLYTSKTKSWRIIGTRPCEICCFKSFSNRSVFADGSIHWICKFKDPSRFSILSFDVETEELSAAAKLDSSDCCCQDTVLIELGGNLAMGLWWEILGIKPLENVWILVEGKWKRMDAVKVDGRECKTSQVLLQPTYRSYYYVNDQGVKWTCSKKLSDEGLQWTSPNKPYVYWTPEIDRFIPEIHRCKETLVSLENF